MTLSIQLGRGTGRQLSLTVQGTPPATSQPPTMTADAPAATAEAATPAAREHGRALVTPAAAAPQRVQLDGQLTLDEIHAPATPAPGDAPLPAPTR